MKFLTQEEMSQALSGSYDPVLVVLSIMVACLAGYAALSVVDRIREARSPSVRRWWLACGALAMGSGIWAMHFTAMLAVSLPLTVRYELWTTLVSVVPAIFGSGIALRIMSRRSPSWWQLQGGALLIAVGIGTMHYTGMAAMHSNGSMVYDPVYFVLSIVVAHLLAWLALYLKFVMSRSGAGSGRVKVASAVVMGFAVAGMHYTAMKAAIFFDGSASGISGLDFPPLAMGVSISMIVSTIMGLTIIGTVIDRRFAEAEESRKAIEAWANAILKTAADGIGSVDEKGTILSFNPAAELIFGFNAQEMIGENIKRLMPPGGADNFDLLRSLALSGTGKVGTYQELSAVRKDGTRFPLEVGITELRRDNRRIFIGSMRDITARKSYEAKLKAHAGQQAVVAELGHEAVLVDDLNAFFDLATERVANVLNVEFCKILELLPGETSLLLRNGVGWREGLVGRATVHPGQDSQAGYTLCNEGPVCVEDFSSESRFDAPALLAEHKVLSGISVTISGRTKPFGVIGAHSTQARKFSQDDINFLVAVGNILAQVVHRVDMEKERALIEGQLLQAQKLESIGRLAAGVAHEINTPTQFIGDNIRFLQDTFNDLTPLLNLQSDLIAASGEGASVEDILPQIATAVETADLDYLLEEIPTALKQSLDGIDRVSGIVRAMKEFSHPGSGEKQEIDLNRAIENTITVTSNEWKFVAEMETRLDPNLPAVQCLPGELNQVILNMIVNAAHAISDVTDNGKQGKGTITLQTLRRDKAVEIRISDTGCGISEENRAKIFDPFFTTKEVGRGTGQGLAITHTVIIEKHGGMINLETEVGKGTTFIIQLPLDSDGGAPLQAWPPGAPQTDSSNWASGHQT